MFSLQGMLTAPLELVLLPLLFGEEVWLSFCHLRKDIDALLTL